MDKMQLRRVQRVTTSQGLERETQRLAMFRSCSPETSIVAAIELICQDRMAKMSQMHSNLMGSSGVQLQAQARRAMERSFYPESGSRLPPTLTDGSSLAIVGVTIQRCVNLARTLVERAPTEPEIHPS